MSTGLKLKKEINAAVKSTRKIKLNASQAKAAEKTSAAIKRQVKADKGNNSPDGSIPVQNSSESNTADLGKLQFVIGWSPELFWKQNNLKGDPRSNDNMLLFKSRQKLAWEEQEKIVKETMVQTDGKHGVRFNRKHGKWVPTYTSKYEGGECTALHYNLAVEKMAKSKAQLEATLVAMVNATHELSKLKGS